VISSSVSVSKVGDFIFRIESVEHQPDRGESAHRLTLQPSEQLLGGLRVVDVRCGHQHRQQHPHAVHVDVAIAAIDVLMLVAPPLLAPEVVSIDWLSMLAVVRGVVCGDESNRCRNTRI